MVMASSLPGFDGDFGDAFGRQVGHDSDFLADYAFRRRIKFDGDDVDRPRIVFRIAYGHGAVETLDLFDAERLAAFDDELGFRSGGRLPSG